MGTSKGATFWSFCLDKSSTLFEDAAETRRRTPRRTYAALRWRRAGQHGHARPQARSARCAPKKASDAIQEATKEWKGLRVTVKLIIENRVPRCEIVNSSTALILRALKEPPRDRKKVKNIRHDGDLTLKDVIDVAQKMRERSQAKKFSGGVCEILGTCSAVGCTVEGQHPQEIIRKIKSGEIEIPE